MTDLARMVRGILAAPFPENRSMSSPSPLPLTPERERFEQFFPRAVEQRDGDTYRDVHADIWEGWQAAVESAVRASLLVPPEDVVHRGIGPSTVERGASNTDGAEAPHGVEEALRELVACKTLMDRLPRRFHADIAGHAEFSRRWPLAWEAARVALTAAPKRV